MNRIRYGLHEAPSKWDVPSQVPVAPIQPQDPALRLNDHPDARYTEYMHRPLSGYDHNGLYVPTQPQTTTRKGGDTVDGILLYEQRPKSCPFRCIWQRMTTGHRMVAPIQTRNHRWAPY